jgi:hypothetical protein
MTAYLDQALRLRSYLAARHWDGSALTGPDAGVRFNYRIGRYVKSYLSFLPWHDAHYYVQAQAYWVLANWRLFDATGDSSFASDATAASREMLGRQRPDGAWNYPNPEWAGRIATAEGTWASLGLLETYRRTRDATFLDGARRWSRYVDSSVGFETVAGGVAVNYFAHRPGDAVPNNSAFLARFLAELWCIDRDDAHRCRVDQLVTFLAGVQRPSGELPYAVALDGGPGTAHFQCFQYNAFQCIDLVACFEATGDPAARALATAQLKFLRQGADATGRPYYDCRKRRRTVTYHAAALAAAFSAAGRIGICGYDELATRAYGWLLERQRDDGGFPTSVHDYGVLTDRRSYPRNHTMILLHLLSA